MGHLLHEKAHLEGKKNHLKKQGWEFPHGPVVGTQCTHCQVLGSIPGWRTKIPQTEQQGQKKKRRKKQGFQHRSITLEKKYIYIYILNKIQFQPLAS